MSLLLLQVPVWAEEWVWEPDLLMDEHLVWAREENGVRLMSKTNHKEDNNLVKLFIHVCA